MNRREFVSAPVALAVASAAPREAAGIGLDSSIEWLATKESLKKLVAAYPRLRHVLIGSGEFRLTRGLEGLPERVRNRMMKVDDALYRRAIENVREAGLKPYGTLVAWKGIGRQSPSSIVRYIDGRRTDELTPSKYATEPPVDVCPNRPEVRSWLETLAGGLFREYDLDGCMTRHASYAHPAFIEGMFGCWCDDCRTAASQLGYNFDAMRGALRKVLTELPKLQKRDLMRAADNTTGFIGLFCRLADSYEPARWFEFRCDSFTTGMRRIRDAVDREKRNKDAGIGFMTWYPSFAPLVGQRYSDFEGAMHFTVLLFNHWQIFYSQSLAGLANWLMENIRGLTEAEALRATHGLIGVDDLPVPESFATMPVPPEAAKRGGGSWKYPESVWETTAPQLCKARARLGKITVHPCFREDFPVSVQQKLEALSARLGFDAVWYQPASRDPKRFA
jgi:hypothetical protein